MALAELCSKIQLLMLMTMFSKLDVEELLAEKRIPSAPPRAATRADVMVVVGTVAEAEVVVVSVVVVVVAVVVVVVLLALFVLFVPLAFAIVTTLAVNMLFSTLIVVLDAVELKSMLTAPPRVAVASSVPFPVVIVVD